MAVAPRSGWHKHHVFPLELRCHDRLGRIFGDLPDGLLSLDDFPSNGMYLPASEAIARAVSLPLHCGPHPRYNRIVRDLALQTINGLGPAPTPRVIIWALTQLQMRLKSILSVVAVRHDVVLGSSDPFGNSPALSELDRKTDIMFADQCARRSTAPWRI